MFIFCTIAGVLCLIYFILLLVYSGLTTVFYFIWLFLSAGFLLTGWLFKIRFFQNLPFPVRLGMILFLSVCLAFFLGVEGMILKGSLTMPKESQDYVIVPLLRK